MSDRGFRGQVLCAHPCPIFTKLRYSLVGSASVQICCRRFTISASFALSSFFFSRRLGVAPAVLARLATAALCCGGAALGCGALRSGTGTVTVAGATCALLGSSTVEGGGDSLLGVLTGAGVAGERRSFVVFARTRGSRGGLGATRWELERSRLGCAGWGGDGAGR
jgi:hypothetical protein